VDDLETKIIEELDGFNLKRRLRKEASVAITGTSRGLLAGPTILKTVADKLKDLSAKPFIVPAMGSHGGASADGQLEVLASLGITSNSMGVPIKASMETVKIGATPSGCPVYIDKHAAGADWLVVVNRIKPHTNFHSPVESGLLKMMAVGLGKADGARAVHQLAAQRGYYRVILEVAKEVIRKSRLLFALATVENLYHDVAIVRALSADKIINEEKKLLTRARELMGRISFNDIDLLIVDEMGKNISGAGMDTNVIGRWPAKTEVAPKIKRIYVRDLTAESHGNAVGVGNADLISRILHKKIDLPATAINALSAGVPEQARLPLAIENDLGAIEVALGTLGLEPAKARIVWIKNTSELAEFKVSSQLVNEAKRLSGLECNKKGQELTFDEKGMLVELP
jgi:hypothetical protein